MKNGCKRKRKAQSAMEYLMTYGWAILIVIIVAAALYALGVFNPATFTGTTSTGFQVLGTPSDWTLESDGTFKITLANNKLPSQVTIRTVKATLRGTTIPITYNTSTCNRTGTTPTSTDTYLSIGPGGSAALETACQVPSYNLTFSGVTSGTTYSVDVDILYNAGGYDKSDSGTVTGVVS